MICHKTQTTKPNLNESVCSLDRTLTSSTAPGQSELGSNSNEGVLHSQQELKNWGPTNGFSLMSYLRYNCRIYLTHLTTPECVSKTLYVSVRMSREINLKNVTLWQICRLIFPLGNIQILWKLFKAEPPKFLDVFMEYSDKNMAIYHTNKQNRKKAKETPPIYIYIYIYIYETHFINIWKKQKWLNFFP